MVDYIERSGHDKDCTSHPMVLAAVYRTEEGRRGTEGEPGDTRWHQLRCSELACGYRAMVHHVALGTTLDTFIDTYKADTHTEVNQRLDTIHQLLDELGELLP